MYTNKGGNVQSWGTLAELDCSASGVAGQSWLVMSKIQVKRLVGIVTTVFSSTAAGVVTFYARPTYGSATSQVSLGTLTVGSSSGSAAVGNVFISKITPVAVNPGNQIVTSVTTVLTTSGKIGAGFEWEDQTEEAKDIAAIVGGT